MSASSAEDAVERICRAAGNYPAFIGPSDMWMLVAEALTPENATEILESLPEKTQKHLRNVYLGLPPAAYIQQRPPKPGDDDRQAVYVQVVRWCEARIALEDIAALPDGVIGVRVEKGVVVERRSGE